MDKNVKNYTFIYFCKAADNSFASTPSFFFEASSLATTSALGSSSPSTDPRRDSDLGLKTYELNYFNCPPSGCEPVWRTDSIKSFENTFGSLVWSICFKKTSHIIHLTFCHILYQLKSRNKFDAFQTVKFRTGREVRSLYPCCP